MDEINPFTNQIRVTCQAADTLPIEQIVEFQGDLKKLTAANREKLFKSIIREGFMAPIFVWKDGDGSFKMLDGHQRIKTLLWMQQRGWDIPTLPVVYIESETETDARRKLLKITSQFGEFDMDELNKWFDEFEKDIVEDIRLVDTEIELFLNSIDGDIQESLDVDFTDKTELIITTKDEIELQDLYEELQNRGYECKISTL